MKQDVFVSSVNATATRRGACPVIGDRHRALLEELGGVPCDYCSQRGQPGCARGGPSRHPSPRPRPFAAGRAARIGDPGSHLGP